MSDAGEELGCGAAIGVVLVGALVVALALGLDCRLDKAEEDIERIKEQACERYLTAEQYRECAEALK